MRLVFTIITILFFSKELDSQQYSFKNYGVTDGLGQSQVQAIVEDNLGYLWVGTRGGGVSRFDGHSFKTYTQKQGLIGDFILSLAFENNELLIGTSTGLCKITTDSIYSKVTSSALDSLIIQDIQLPYFATSNGLFKLERDSVFKVELETNLCSFGIYQLASADNDIFGATDKGIIKISNDNQSCIRNINRIRNNFFKSVITDSKGNIWCGSLGGGVTKITPSGEEFNYSKSNGMNSIDVNTIYEDSKGIIWVGSNGQGVTKYDGNTFTHITQKNGLSNDFVHSIFEDSYGNIWFGTSNGLSKLTSEKYILYGENSFLSEGGAYTIHRDYYDNVWLSTFNGGVRLNENKFSHPDFANRRVKVITSSLDSTVWIGSDGGGIYTYKNKQLNKLPIGNIWCRDIKQLDSSTMLLATLGNGIYVYTEDTIINIQVGDTKQSNRINQLIIDSSKAYLATDEGVFVYQNTLISKTNMPNERFVTATKIEHIHFYGSMGKGVIRFNPNTSETSFLNIQNHLSSNNVYALYGHNQRLFVGSEKGLDEYLFNDEKLKKIRTHHQEDGFLGIETLRNGISSDSNYYYIATVNGLVRYDPKLEKRKDYSNTSILRLESIELYYNTLQKGDWFSDSLHLHKNMFSSNENHFTFRFSTADLNQKSSIKYKWRLVGFDNIWTTPSYQQFATFPNLPPGNYRFEVQSLSNSDWSKIVSQSFVIDAPFWQKTWFYILLAISFLIISLLTVVIIFKRIKRKNESERERLITERKMIELEQQAVRLQMNPHFLFNSLNAIKGAVAQQQTKEAKKAIDQFAKLMRAMLDNTKEGFVTIKKEIELIDLYLKLEQLNHSFVYSISIDESISTTAKIPGMMIQPLVENAVLHGVSLKANGEITINFKYQSSNYILCEVSDNGIGIQKSKENKRDSVHRYESKATTIIQSRLSLLTKEFKEVSFYTDSTDKGTTVRLILPILL